MSGRVRTFVFGEQHMDHLVSETVEHYHEDRPHQSLGNEPPVNRHMTETPGSDIDETKLRIVCRERLGERLNGYSLRGGLCTQSKPAECGALIAFWCRAVVRARRCDSNVILLSSQQLQGPQAA